MARLLIAQKSWPRLALLFGSDSYLGHVKKFGRQKRSQNLWASTYNFHVKVVVLTSFPDSYHISKVVWGFRFLAIQFLVPQYQRTWFFLFLSHSSASITDPSSGYFNPRQLPLSTPFAHIPTILERFRVPLFGFTLPTDQLYIFGSLVHNTSILDILTFCKSSIPRNTEVTFTRCQ